MKNKLYIFLILVFSLFAILSFSSFAAVDNSEGFTLTFTNDEISFTSTQFSGSVYYEGGSNSIAGNTPSRTFPNIYRVTLNCNAPGSVFYYNDLRLSGLHFDFYLLGDTTIEIHDEEIYISGPALSVDVDSTNLTFDVASGWTCPSNYIQNLNGDFAIDNLTTLYISLGYSIPDGENIGTVSNALVYGSQVNVGDEALSGSHFLFSSDSFSIIVGSFTSNTFDSDILSFCSWLSVYGTLEGAEEPPVDPPVDPPVAPPSGSGGALGSILALFLAVSSWLGQALGAIIPMFWTGSELTLIGVLSVTGLAFSVSFLLLALISRFISFGR